MDRYLNRTFQCSFVCDKKHLGINPLQIYLYTSNRWDSNKWESFWEKKRKKIQKLVLVLSSSRQMSFERQLKNLNLHKRTSV